MNSALEHVFSFLFKYPPRLYQQGDLVWRPVLPTWALIASLLIALAVVYWSVTQLRGIRPVDRRIIAGLRTWVLLAIAVCLLQPGLSLSSAVSQRNVLAILLDDSRSMSIRDVDSLHRTAAIQRALSDSAAIVKQLAGKFSLRWFRFGADAAPISGPSGLSASGAHTDIATSLATVRQDLADVPVAGIIVASDGADNGTGDLAAELDALRVRRVPVYTIGVGSEEFGRDVALDRLDLPTTTLVGSGTMATATVAAHGVGRDSLVITAEADGHIVATAKVLPPSGRATVEVPLRIPPLSVGTHLMSVRVEPIAGELVAENNVAQSLLRVRPGYERVLYLEGEPRPEFGFLRRAFEGDSAVRLVGLLRSAKGKFLRINVADSVDLVGGFPTRRQELYRYRGLILGNIEASFFTGDQLRMIADFVDRRGGALLALGGREALAEGGYAGTPIADVLPFTLESGARPGADTTVRTLKVVPTAAGLVHPALQLAATLAVDTARWDSLPTLTAVNHPGELRPGATVLLAGRMANRNEIPVLAVQRYGRGLAAVLNTQDTWTWKMDPRSPVENRSYETFWRQLVRWSLDQVPDRVELTTVPDRIGPGDPVTLRSRVADSIFADVNDASVVAHVVTPTGRELDVPLEWTMKNDGTYFGRLVAQEPGQYRISAIAVRGKDTVTSAPVTVLADARGADMEHAERRPALLKRVANETGGRYYDVANLSHLPDDVQLTRSGITARETRDLWDAPAMLIVLLMLLGGEWAYRRWRGLA